MEKKESTDLILNLLDQKAGTKQKVFRATKEVFQDVKAALSDIYNDIKGDVSKMDEKIRLDLVDKGEFESRLKIAGDVLIYSMHTNVFDFHKSHHLYKTSYVREDEYRAFCGMINVYNFLSDSFTYNRGNDLGYLVARIFVNKEKHFFVEGKHQLGFLYNDFVGEPISKEKVRQILESTILYCLNFDMLTPPYEQVNLLSLSDMREVSSGIQMKTGKRLGFQFQADNDFVD